MPRFTPWHAKMPIDRAMADTCLEEVIRPSLLRAFPLPEQDHAADQRFGGLLEALMSKTAGHAGHHTL
jgi:hypothetical protein